MAGDWIKLHRGLLESPIIKHAGLFQLWGYCLLRASWKDGRWIVPGTTTSIDVPRGSFITGRSALHHELYPRDDGRDVATPSALTVWRWLHTLEGMGCLKLRNVNNRCTLVTICNYGKYQEDDTNYDPPLNSRRTTDEQPLNTVEERKKERKKEQTLFAAAPDDASPGLDSPQPSDSPPLSGHDSDPEANGSTSPAKTTRKRDPLFDAIAEITASDPKASAPHIGRVRRVLLSAEPPYTPEEVYRLREIAPRELSWAEGRHLTLGEVEKYIGRVRHAARPVEAKPAAANGRAPAESLAERIARMRAQQQQEQAP